MCYQIQAVPGILCVPSDFCDLLLLFPNRDTINQPAILSQRHDHDDNIPALIAWLANKVVGLWVFPCGLGAKAGRTVGVGRTLALDRQIKYTDMQVTGSISTWAIQRHPHPPLAGLELRGSTIR